MDFWVVTTHFNPARYASRRRNQQLFVNALRLQGVPCLTIECALAGQPFELPTSPDVVRVVAQSPLWHKERLVQLALEHLPKLCAFVAWVDADVLFCNADWLPHARQQLQKRVAVQLFEYVDLLDKAALPDPGVARQRLRGFGAQVTERPEVLQKGQFDAHGHTGFAWAASRELLEQVGLYPACIAGSADHVMAHAFVLDAESACVTRLLGHNTPHHRHFLDWACALRRFAQKRALQGVGFVPGSISHLWHGAIGNRRYLERNRVLQELGFDPEVDLIGLSGRPTKPLRLRQPNGPISQYLAQYFQSRLEDD